MRNQNKGQHHNYWKLFTRLMVSKCIGKEQTDQVGIRECLEAIIPNYGWDKKNATQ